jgi:hypothetical protein
MDCHFMESEKIVSKGFEKFSILSRPDTSVSQQSFEKFDNGEILF